MKVIIDTNVLVSAILKDRIPEQVILFVVEHPDFEWLVSTEILEEYKTVIRRPKFKLSPEIIEKWSIAFDMLTTCIDVTLKVDFPRDQKDAKFLACAIAGSANFLITGDRDFNEAQKLLNTTILSLTNFHQIVIANFQP